MEPVTVDNAPSVVNPTVATAVVALSEGDVEEDEVAVTVAAAAEVVVKLAPVVVSVLSVDACTTEAE